MTFFDTVAGQNAVANISNSLNTIADALTCKDQVVKAFCAENLLLLLEKIEKGRPTGYMIGSISYESISSVEKAIVIYEKRGI